MMQSSCSFHRVTDGVTDGVLSVVCLAQASKAALSNFFDTLRVEMGNEIGITIATPGWVESEMTAGKLMTASGQVDWDQKQRDVSEFSCDW